jgi:hypothetical protein
MKSKMPGASTSKAEVTNMGAHGLWVFVGGKEYLLPYKEYPWFKNATVSQILGLPREPGQISVGRRPPEPLSSCPPGSATPTERIANVGFDHNARRFISGEGSEFRGEPLPGTGGGCAAREAGDGFLRHRDRKVSTPVPLTYASY